MKRKGKGKERNRKERKLIENEKHTKGKEEKKKDEKIDIF